MMIIIYLNEMKNITLFIYNFNYIKDLSNIIMKDKCNSIYCEAETDRYQIAKNSYNLLLPNDIFNSKMYIIFTFIIAIMIFIYYYYLLFDSGEDVSTINVSSYYYIINFLLLAILLGVIIFRYVPNDDAGYLNYFGKINDTSSFHSYFHIYISLIIMAITYYSFLIKKLTLQHADLFIIIVKYLCFLLAIILIFNLMNIVMTFRSNTKPILKTKKLIWSLKNSLKTLLNNFTKEQKDLIIKTVGAEYAIVEKLSNINILDSSVDTETISLIINILIAFDELSNIILGGYANEDNTNIKYIIELQKIIKDNNDKLIGLIGLDKNTTSNASNVSELSLIFDKKVKIPHDYDTKGYNEHNTNSNDNNSDYIYTADISYDNANLFYEKYWDLNDTDDTFLYKNDYFVPTYLFGGYRPNLYKILIVIIVFIMVIYILGFIVRFFQNRLQNKISELLSELYSILYPLFIFIILIVYIILFIRFNTKFNTNVVYKCLDSSYKRSLNKLNNIVTPYIRMYDNKIIKGDKNYIKHYIITNVFYSILSGNIKLLDNRAILLVKLKKTEAAIFAIKKTLDKLPTQPNQTQIDNIKGIIGKAIVNVKDTISEAPKGSNDLTQQLNTIKDNLEKINSEIITSNIVAIKNRVNTEYESISFILNIDDAILLLKSELIKLPKLPTQTQIDNIKGTIDKAIAAINGSLQITQGEANKSNITNIKIELESIKSVIQLNNIPSINSRVSVLKNKSEGIIKDLNTPIKSIINENEEDIIYYDIPRIKASRLKLSNMNNSILSNDNEFREYYKSKFSNLYDEAYNKEYVANIYNVFIHIFNRNIGIDSILKTEKDIGIYFEDFIINKDTILKIYCIIKKCFNLFNEEKFNSNLIYYNNHENKQKGINIDTYNKFKFYKYGDKVIPYKFILKLKTFDEYTEFVKDISFDMDMEFDKVIEDNFDLSKPSPSSTNTKKAYTNILLDNDDEDLLGQTSDMQQKQDKNLIKLITKYLLILGHINYNSIETTATNTEAGKKEIYEKKTYYLYKLISNILYDDTYEIDDTFNTNINRNQNTSVASIAVKNEGSGYTSAPIIEIIQVGGTGTGATASAVFKPTPIESIRVITKGSGYTKAPSITIKGGGGKDATAVAVLSESRDITSITVTNEGSGYTSVPTIIIGMDVGGVGATAEAVLKATSIESIIVTNGGSDYTNIPKINIREGGGKDSTAVALNSLLINDGDYEKYKHLTYIYNYLETKFVNISSNNNKNYLMNIIKSINNKINDDDKILNTETKSARYLFSKNIKNIKTPEEFENEDEILNLANNVSTSSLASTYIFNIILLIIYFNIISRNIK
jgi:hypothetical protein